MCFFEINLYTKKNYLSKTPNFCTPSYCTLLRELRDREKKRNINTNVNSPHLIYTYIYKQMNIYVDTFSWCPFLCDIQYWALDRTDRNHCTYSSSNIHALNTQISHTQNTYLWNTTRLFCIVDFVLPQFYSIYYIYTKNAHIMCIVICLCVQFRSNGYLELLMTYIL